MAKTKTLAQVASEVEKGQIYFEETNISMGNFESFSDFMHYYRQHYLPLLEAIREGKTLSKEQRRLLNFLADDLIKAFHEEDN